MQAEYCRPSCPALQNRLGVDPASTSTLICRSLPNTPDSVFSARCSFPLYHKNIYISL
jgi:hypothetical protein